MPQTPYGHVLRITWFQSEPVTRKSYCSTSVSSVLCAKARVCHCVIGGGVGWYFPALSQPWHVLWVYQVLLCIVYHVECIHVSFSSVPDPQLMMPESRNYCVFPVLSFSHPNSQPSSELLRSPVAFSDKSFHHRDITFSKVPASSMSQMERELGFRYILSFLALQAQNWKGGPEYIVQIV